MNYIREINAFYDWLETNSIAVSSIAVWHALMHICNKTGWLPEFAVAVSVLSAKTGLEKRTIYNARNELRQKGRIDFKERRGNQSALYSIICFCDYAERENSGAKNAYNLSHNTSLNHSHNTSLNLTPLDLDLNRSNISTKKTKQNKIVDNSSTKSPILELLNQYKELWVKHFNSPEVLNGVVAGEIKQPVINYGKDGKHLKDLLSTNKPETIALLLIDFFNSDDPWIKDSGYTIGVFYSVFTRLLAVRSKRDNVIDQRRKELIEEFGDIDFTEFPGGPFCKCKGQGILPHAERNDMMMICPCTKIYKKT